MNTQTALYNALVKYLDENKVDEEAIDAYSESIKILVEKIEDGKPILNQLHTTYLSIETIHGKINEIIENIDPLLSTGIYERCRRLKDDIDLFESQILFQLSSEAEKNINPLSHGLRNRERVNVFLVGEFSAGKTTFAQRLISDLTGPISGAPATACLVIHKQAVAQSLVITFNNTFVVNDTGNFEQLLHTNDLRKRFNFTQGTWVPNEREITLVNWDSGKIINFLHEANKYPEAFSKIVWNHKKSRKTDHKNTFLDFVDLFDMPGIGGNEGKHDPIIKNVFQEHKPDIILYLIDTSKGTPSEDEVKSLRKLLSYIAQYTPPPLFYWVYQKPSGSYSPLDMQSIDGDGNILDTSFLKEKWESIVNFIDELESGRTITFEKEHIEYLRKTVILDARGLADDTEMSQNAVSLALRDYFCACGNGYVGNAAKILSGDSKIRQFDVMSYYPRDMGYSSKNPFIENVIDSIRKSSDLSVSNAKNIILKFLCIDNDEDISKYPYDLCNTLTEWLKNIQCIIDEIIKEISVKNLLRKSEKISIDNIDNKFWKQYEGKHKWQSLLFSVQAYHWIKASYDKAIAPQYINKIGNAILASIEKDVSRLSKININLPIYKNVVEETD
jgi:hypothetical protein